LLLSLRLLRLLSLLLLLWLLTLLRLLLLVGHRGGHARLHNLDLGQLIGKRLDFTVQRLDFRGVTLLQDTDGVVLFCQNRRESGLDYIDWPRDNSYTTELKAT
jgi:hypothetical protein